MKLIINISDESYDKALNGIINCKECFDAIVYGTPIPDNATNGDVLISLYPNLKYTIQNGRVITTIGVASSFDLDWWNSPYQKGGRNADSD